MKHSNKAVLAAALIAVAANNGAWSAEFNPLVGNPFLFCSAPRPCKLCQPYRRIYSEICDSQNQAKNKLDSETAETPQELQARNNATTPAQLNEAREAGAKALVEARKSGNVSQMDDQTSDLTFNAFAAGWNAELTRQRGRSASY